MTPPLRKKSESEVTQWCPTLLNPMDCILPGSPIHGILQARTLEWAAISFSRGSSQPRDHENEREEWKCWLKLIIKKTKIMASSPICSWQIYREKVETRAYFIFSGFKITMDSNYSHEIKRHLLFGRKAMTILSESENEVAQLCLTLCDPMDCSLPGSSVHRIFQARVLEWAAISFSRGSSQPRDRTRSPALQADTLTSEPPGNPKERCYLSLKNSNTRLLASVPKCTGNPEPSFSSWEVHGAATARAGGWSSC